MSQDLNSISTSLLANIDKDLEDAPILSGLQKTFGLRPSYLFLLATGVVLFLAIFDIIGHLITTLFGMLYPSYMSYKSIQKNNEQQKKVWLTYWIVFGLLTSLDDNIGWAFNFIPGFYALRLVVYIWMFYPRANNGATIIYKHLKPFLVQFKNKLGTKQA